MAIAAAGSLNFRPFTIPYEGAPVGYLIGAGEVTGDASGGSEVITFNISTDFCFSLIAASSISEGNVALVHQIYLQTGIRQGGVDELYGASVTVPSSDLLEMHNWDLPRMLFRPEGQAQATLDFRVANVLNRIFRARCRFFLFPVDVLSRVPPVAASYLLAR